MFTYEIHMKTQKTKVVSCRITEKLAELIRKHCEIDMHINTADFIRDAIREKIERETQLFKEVKKRELQS